jgi:hypothetical protein
LPVCPGKCRSRGPFATLAFSLDDLAVERPHATARCAHSIGRNGPPPLRQFTWQ